LRDKYRNQEGLVESLGHRTRRLGGPRPGLRAPLPSAGHPAIEQDYSAFLRLLPTSTSRPCATPEMARPNHLLLGGRFGEHPGSPGVLRQYCDLLSFNLYAATPQQGYDAAYVASLDKPVLISEFHFGSRDRGPFWGGVWRWPTSSRGGATSSSSPRR
jgi:hypothetical protein